MCPRKQLVDNSSSRVDWPATCALTWAYISKKVNRFALLFEKKILRLREFITIY